MAIQHILTNLNAFVAGKGYLGRVTEFTPPKLSPVVREYKAGGMSAEVAIPMGAVEKLECDFTLTGYDPDLFREFAVVPGRLVPLRFTGAMVDYDGTTRPIEITLRAVLAFEPDAWKPAEASDLKISAMCHYYKLDIEGRTLHEIDPVNLVAIIDGTDQLAELRAALGA
ncbi:MAG: bacteriophage protein [Porticoccaceae bacterium]|nr:MAG: bacteriophage protein [Porticoccaceae bacterium]